MKINPETISNIKNKLAGVKRISLKTAKYGAVFSGGVLVGTICGVVLFFKISDGDF